VNGVPAWGGEGPCREHSFRPKEQGTLLSVPRDGRGQLEAAGWERGRSEHPGSG
jgi:hypothetical protein